MTAVESRVVCPPQSEAERQDELCSLRDSEHAGRPTGLRAKYQLDELSISDDELKEEFDFDEIEFDGLCQNLAHEQSSRLGEYKIDDVALSDEDELADFNKLVEEQEKERRAGVDIPHSLANISGHGDGEDNLPTVRKSVTSVADFIRNFLLKNRMPCTLENFESEWYRNAQESMSPKGGTNGASESIPHICLSHTDLQQRVEGFELELAKTKETADDARNKLGKIAKERDYFRMHYRRVLQEKQKLTVDAQRVKKHFQRYEPLMNELKSKYETAMKEKMLIRLDRDRLTTKIENLQKHCALVQQGRQSRGPELGPTDIEGSVSLPPTLSSSVERPSDWQSKTTGRHRSHANLSTSTEQSSDVVAPRG
eukprot:GHVQ01014235.1.p1 GENE.GHVQ01014235.1~~GHVQ01014235.1.p1  ORF type:complete len:368 (-),score=38.77 GHVQ01014235.1:427-1530(-)